MATNVSDNQNESSTDIEEQNQRLVEFCLNSMGEPPLGVSYFRDLANEEPLTAPKPATLKQMINDVKARH
ncbi:hypothetical protein FRC14_008282, partial [Serendipita sp. 396]